MLCGVVLVCGVSPPAQPKPLVLSGLCSKIWSYALSTETSFELNAPVKQFNPFSMILGGIPRTSSCLSEIFEAAERHDGWIEYCVPPLYVACQSQELSCIQRGSGGTLEAYWLPLRPITGLPCPNVGIPWPQSEFGRNGIASSIRRVISQLWSLPWCGLFSESDQVSATNQFEIWRNEARREDKNRRWKITR